MSIYRLLAQTTGRDTTVPIAPVLALVRLAADEDVPDTTGTMPGPRFPSRKISMLSKMLMFGARRRVVPVFASLMIAVLASTVGAQTYQGGLRGRVRDPQGIIPGAEVTLASVETGASRTVASNEVGEYVFTGVLPGVYSVRVALPGFKTEERKGLRIATQQTVVQ